MNAADLLISRLAQSGITLSKRADQLILDGPEELVTDELVREIRAAKAAIMTELAKWDAGDWQTYYHERAGIAEHVGGLSRDQAEARAKSCCIAEWLDRNHPNSLPNLCLGCGAAEGIRDPLLPYGGSQIGHAWLHGRCWPDWFAGRKAEAKAAVTRLLGLA